MRLWKSLRYVSKVIRSTSGFTHSTCLLYASPFLNEVVMTLGCSMNLGAVGLVALVVDTLATVLVVVLAVERRRRGALVATVAVDLVGIRKNRVDSSIIHPRG